jgi:hypothetical protein
MPVHTYKLGSHWQDFCEICYCTTALKSVIKIQIWFILKKEIYQVLYMNLMLHCCWQHELDIKTFCNNMQKTQCCIFMVTFSIFIVLTAIFSTTLNRMHYCISTATISILILLTKIYEAQHYLYYWWNMVWGCSDSQGGTSWMTHKVSNTS